VDLPRAGRPLVVRHIPRLAAFPALGGFLFQQRQEQVSVLVRPQRLGLAVSQSSVGVVEVSGDGLSAKEP